MLQHLELWPNSARLLPVTGSVDSKLMLLQVEHGDTINVSGGGLKNFQSRLVKTVLASWLSVTFSHLSLRLVVRFTALVTYEIQA